MKFKANMHAPISAGKVPSYLKLLAPRLEPAVQSALERRAERTLPSGGSCSSSASFQASLGLPLSRLSTGATPGPVPPLMSASLQNGSWRAFFSKLIISEELKKKSLIVSKLSKMAFCPILEIMIRFFFNRRILVKIQKE